MLIAQNLRRRYIATAKKRFKFPYKSKPQKSGTRKEQKPNPDTGGVLRPLTSVGRRLEKVNGQRIVV